jgi:glutamyl-tRNA reductase
LSILVCVGLNHKTAPVEIRERAAISDAQQSRLLKQTAVGAFTGISELAVISTCNRTELYAVSNLPSVPTILLQLLTESGKLTEHNLSAYTYSLVGEDCIEHLMHVAAGLDSQVLGEPQILGQVTDAYELANGLQATDTTLATLMQYAIRTGKRVRSETPLGEGALSISAVAAMYAREQLGPLDQASVLIIGAGEMARTAAGSFVRRGVDKLIIANRTFEHAAELAAQYNGKAVPFTGLSDVLLEVDLVVSAAASAHPLLYKLYKDDLLAILPRRQRPLIIFDLAMPRNIDPEVGKLQGVQLYDLDDLQAASNEHYNRRRAAIPQAETIVAEEANNFAQWYASRAVAPTIQQLRGKADAIREAELEQLLRRLPNLSEGERALIAEFSTRLVNKLLHEPTLQLKKYSVGESAGLYSEILSDLFNLKATIP